MGVISSALSLTSGGDRTLSPSHVLSLRPLAQLRPTSPTSGSAWSLRRWRRRAAPLSLLRPAGHQRWWRAQAGRIRRGRWWPRLAAAAAAVAASRADPARAAAALGGRAWWR